MEIKEINQQVNQASGEIADELLAIGGANAMIKRINWRLGKLLGESLRALFDREAYAKLRKEYWDLRAQRARIRKDRDDHKETLRDLCSRVQKIGYDVEQKKYITAAAANQSAKDASVSANNGVIEFTEASSDGSSEQ